MPSKRKHGTLNEDIETAPRHHIGWQHAGDAKAAEDVVSQLKKISSGLEWALGTLAGHEPGRTKAALERAIVSMTREATRDSEQVRDFGLSNRASSGLPASPSASQAAPNIPSKPRPRSLAPKELPELEDIIESIADTESTEQVVSSEDAGRDQCAWPTWAATSTGVDAQEGVVKAGQDQEESTQNGFGTEALVSAKNNGDAPSIVIMSTGSPISFGPVVRRIVNEFDRQAASSSSPMPIVSAFQEARIVSFLHKITGLHGRRALKHCIEDWEVSRLALEASRELSPSRCADVAERIVADAMSLLATLGGAGTFLKMLQHHRMHEWYRSYLVLSNAERRKVKKLMADHLRPAERRSLSKDPNPTTRKRSLPLERLLREAKAVHALTTALTGGIWPLMTNTAYDVYYMGCHVGPVLAGLVSECPELVTMLRIILDNFVQPMIDGNAVASIPAFMTSTREELEPRSFESAMTPVQQHPLLEV
ncbi:hypothetical protein LTR17_006109 [Elasticomyces elasticus]|nr:hypothetical protein LTR17_006109 [Elasticomyces elasticus]